MLRIVASEQTEQDALKLDLDALVRRGCPADAVGGAEIRGG